MKSFNQLIEELQSDHTDEYWTLIGDVVSRFEAEAIQFVGESITSGNPSLIVLGLDIAYELENPPEDASPKAHKVISESIHQISPDNVRDTEILRGMVNYYGLFTENIECVKKILEIAKIPEAQEITLDIVRALAYVFPTTDPRLVLPSLLDYANNEDDEVRSWAIFGLGSRELPASNNRSTIVSVLKAHLDDVPNVKDEAIMALANYGDASGKKPLAKLLRSNKEASLLNIEAAGKYGDSIFLKDLMELSKSWEANALLFDWAIKRCSPDPKIRDSVLDEFIQM